MSRQPTLASNGWTNRYVAESNLEHFVKENILYLKKEMKKMLHLIQASKGSF